MFTLVIQTHVLHNVENKAIPYTLKGCLKCDVPGTIVVT